MDAGVTGSRHTLPNVASAGTATPMGCIAAPYFYPSFAGSGWDTLQATPAERGIIIANVNSGSDGSTNSDWEREINQARTVGWRVIGYVTCDPTGLGGMDAGTQPVADVKDDVDDWYTYYNVDGIFYDLTPTGIQVAGAAYMQEICEYVRTKGVAQTVVINPGTYPLTGDLVAPADHALVWEGHYTDNNYPGFAIPGYATWVPQYTPNKYLHLVYGANEAQMRLAAAHALELGAGHLYVSSSTSNWESLPSYWAAEAALLRTLRPEMDPLDRRNHNGPLAPVAPALTGARDDPESALANLIATLANLGIITDSTTVT